MLSSKLCAPNSCIHKSDFQRLVLDKNWETSLNCTFQYKFKVAVVFLFERATPFNVFCVEFGIVGDYFAVGVVHVEAASS